MCVVNVCKLLYTFCNAEATVVNVYGPVQIVAPKPVALGAAGLSVEPLRGRPHIPLCPGTGEHEGGDIVDGGRATPAPGHQRATTVMHIP